MAQDHLPLLEQFFLLSIRDWDGLLQFSLPRLRGAAIADLALQGYISIEDKPRKRAYALKPSFSGSFYMNQTFDKIKERPDRSITKHALKEAWVPGEEAREELLRELGRRGILREQPKEHWLSRTRYVVLKPKLKQQIQAKVRNVYAGAEKGDTELLTLLALVEDTYDFKDTTGGDWWWKRRRRVKELCREDTIAKVILASVRDAENRQKSATHGVGGGDGGGGGGCDGGGGGC